MLEKTMPCHLYARRVSLSAATFSIAWFRVPLLPLLSHFSPRSPD